MEAPFGDMLRDWRRRRRMSQLELGLVAEVSARHIAFLETGRSRPSRAMVLRLSEALDVPRAARNPLLTAAGFATAYRKREPSDDEMAPVRMAIRWMLERHAPYPAIAIDRHWHLADINAPARLLLGAVGLGAGDSLLDALTLGSPLAQAIESWPDLARHMLARLRTESAYLGGDEVLDRAAARLAEQGAGMGSEPTGALPAVVATRYRIAGVTLSLMSTIAQFGSAEDIALADLRIELMFPADEATRLALEQMASSRA